MVDLSKQILAVADLLGEAIRAGRFDVDKHLVELRTIAADVEALEKELADAYKDIDREEQWAKQVTAEVGAMLSVVKAAVVVYEDVHRKGDTNFNDLFVALRPFLEANDEIK